MAGSALLDDLLPRYDVRSRHAVDVATPGCAKALMSIRVEPVAPAATRLATETRVACCDAGAAWRFRCYWALIAPFSGLIRWEMLRGIRRAAEAATRD